MKQIFIHHYTFKTSKRKNTRNIIYKPFHLKMSLHSFYGLYVPLYFSHHYSLGALSIILLLVGTQYDDPFVGPLSAIVHFYALHFFLGFSLCVSCFLWPMTPISLALSISSPSRLIILLPIWFLWGYLLNIPSA